MQRWKLTAATAPIESTGKERHDISLLVANGDSTRNAKFRDLAAFLRTGDVLVVNTSATEPAAIEGWLEGAAVDVHVAGPARDGHWIVELRKVDRSGPVLDAQACDRVEIDGGSLLLLEPVEIASDRVRLWKALWRGTLELTATLRTHGHPIRYAYVPDAWPIEMYRTIFEVDRLEFSSAEMPSAARPFTPHVIDGLRHTGVEIVPIALHTGVSSLESDEGPRPERFDVSSRSADRINSAIDRGNHVIAVGTTSARAVESAAVDGQLVPRSGWTDLVLSRQRPSQVINGIISGWHPPEASHLDLLESVVGSSTLGLAYRDAARRGYRSHEFGDSCLLLGETDERPISRR